MVDGRGHAYVNGAGFNPMAGEPFQPGFVFLVTADGSVREVADDIAFPNGMAVTGDNSTLIVADSYRHSLVAFDIGADGGLSGRRIWADLGEGTPDGICVDEQNAGGQVLTTEVGLSSRRCQSGRSASSARGCPSRVSAETPGAIAWDVSAKTPASNADLIRAVSGSYDALAWPSRCSRRSCRSRRPGAQSVTKLLRTGAVQGVPP